MPLMLQAIARCRITSVRLRAISPSRLCNKGSFFHKSGCLEGQRFFAVASSTRKIGMVIFQRRKVIAPSIALSCIFFNKPSPPGFGREKKRSGEEIH
jgi:hypothetical protein